MTARWRPKAEMTSPFDSSNPISLGRPLKVFVYLLITVQKLFECIDLAGILVPKFGVFGGFLTPKCNFVSTRPPKRTSLRQTASFEPLCVQIGSADWAAEAYKNKKGKVRYSKKVEVIFHLTVGPPPANRLQSFLAHRVSLPTLLTLQNFMLIG